MRPTTARVTVANPIAYVRLDQYHGAALAVQAVIEAASGGVGTVWSAADAALATPPMTITNGGLSVQYTGAANWQSIRTSTSKAQSSGKFYFEFLCPATPIDFVIKGIVDPGFDVSTNIGGAIFSGGLFNASTPQGSGGFTQVGTLGSFTAVPNDVWGFAVDMSADLLWIAQNNVWVTVGGNPATGANPLFTWGSGGTPMLGCLSFHGGDEGVWTLRPSAASQTYAAPSGFTAWDAASGAYQIDYSFDDPNDTVNPVALASMAWDNSLIPAIAKTATSNCTFTIPTAPIWARVQCLAGATAVRAIFTQYEAHRTTMVARVPPS